MWGECGCLGASVYATLTPHPCPSPRSGGEGERGCAGGAIFISREPSPLGWGRAGMRWDYAASAATIFPRPRRADRPSSLRRGQGEESGYGLPSVSLCSTAHLRAKSRPSGGCAPKRACGRSPQRGEPFACGRDVGCGSYGNGGLFNLSTYC